MQGQKLAECGQVIGCEKSFRFLLEFVCAQLLDFVCV